MRTRPASAGSPAVARDDAEPAGASRWPTRRDLATLAVVFVLALGARLAFLAVDGTRLEPDSTEYFLLAQNLRTHRVFSMSVSPPFDPSIRRPPVYPVFLAAFGWTSVASARAVAVAQCFIDAMTAVALLALARMVVNARWALGTAVAYALHPGPVSYTSTIISEPLFTLLLVVSVLVLSTGLARGSWRVAASGFAVLGAAGLCRAIALPLLFVFAGLVLLTKQGRARRGRVALLLASALLVIVPWLVRSSAIAGRFVPVHSGASVNVYEPSRTTPDGVADPYYTRRDAARTPAEQIEADRLGFAQALENLASDPVQYVRRRAAAFPYLFLTSFDRFTGIDAPYATLYAGGAYALIAAKLAMLLIFAAAPLLLALVALRRATATPAALLCAGVWCYTLVIHIPLWIEYRFWLPALPFLLVSASAGASLLVSSRGGSRARLEVGVSRS